MSHSCLDDEGAINVAAGMMKFMLFLGYLYLNDDIIGTEKTTSLGIEMQNCTELQGFKSLATMCGPCHSLCNSSLYQAEQIIYEQH